MKLVQIQMTNNIRIFFGILFLNKISFEIKIGFEYKILIPYFKNTLRKIIFYIFDINFIILRKFTKFLKNHTG